MLESSMFTEYKKNKIILVKNLFNEEYHLSSQFYKHPRSIGMAIRIFNKTSPNTVGESELQI